MGQLTSAYFYQDPIGLWLSFSLRVTLPDDSLHTNLLYNSTSVLGWLTPLIYISPRNHDLVVTVVAYSMKAWV